MFRITKPLKELVNATIDTSKQQQKCRLSCWVSDSRVYSTKEILFAS